MSRPHQGVRPGKADLQTLHRVAQERILQRRDLGAAGQDTTVRAMAERHARKWRVAIDWTPAGAAVLAQVNSGRWQGVCPDCGGGEYLNVDEPLFWCCSCANVRNGHQPRPVVFPPAEERAAIEAVLCRRAGPVLPGQHSPRNWEPGDSVETLAIQNLERGDEVPPEISERLVRGGGRGR